MRTIRINLVVFAVLATATIVWGATTLFSFERIERPFTVTAEFESSPGLTSGFQVTYLGTRIGTVSAVDLEPGKSVVELKIDRGVEIPATLQAAARRQSAIGEPYVNLEPREGTNPDEGPRLQEGDTVELKHTTVPISYAALFKSVENLVNAVEPEPLEILFREIAAALQDRGDEWRTIIVGSRDLTDNLVENADAIDQMIADIGSLAEIAADNRDSITTSIDNLTVLADSLTELEGPVSEFLVDAPPLVNLLNRVLAQADESLLCTVDGLTALREIATPEALAALSDSIDKSDTGSAIIAAVLGDDGIVDLGVTLAALEDLPEVYDTRLPPPTAPSIPGCDGFDVDFTAAGASDRAGPGAGSDGPTGADGTVDVPGATEDVDVTLAGASDLPQPDDPFLAKVIGWFVPAAALALLAAAGWLLFTILRQRRAT